MFTPGVSRGFELRLGWTLADAVPTALWNISRPAECQPGLTGTVAASEQLLSRQIAELTEHQIMREGTPIHCTELVGDRGPKLTQTHTQNLTGKQKMPGSQAGHPSQSRHTARHSSKY